MRENEVKELTDRVLGPLLGPLGFRSSDVEAKPDHDGEDSLYITLHFLPGEDTVSGRAYLQAHMAMEVALKEKGEDRFPYFKYDTLNETIPFDEVEAYGS